MSDQTTTLTALGEMVTEIAGLAVRAEEQAAQQDPDEVAWSPQHQRVTWRQNDLWVQYMPLYSLLPCPVCQEEIHLGFIHIADGTHGGLRVSFETLHVLMAHGSDLRQADPGWKKDLLATAALLRSTLGV